MENFKSTHSQENYTSTQYQFNSEISKMCEKGVILNTFDSVEAQDLYLEQHRRQKMHINC